MRYFRVFAFSLACLFAVTPTTADSQDSEPQRLREMTPDEIAGKTSSELMAISSTDELKQLSDEQKAALRSVMMKEMAAGHAADEKRNRLFKGLRIACAAVVGIFIRRWVRNRLSS